MSDDTEKTLAERWTARLKNNRWIAVAIIVAGAIGATATFAESAKKLLEALGIVTSKPASPTIFSVVAPPPSPPGASAPPPQPSAPCISLVDVALWETDLSNVEQLVSSGESLVHPTAVPAGLYERIKNWEDLAYSELESIDRHHPTFTAFSYEFEYWRTQDRRGTEGNASVVSSQMERNLGHLRRARQFCSEAVAEAKAKACKS